MISNIKLTSFQINLILELFMCLRLELLKLLIKNFVSIIFFSFQIDDFKYFAIFLLFTLLLEFAQFFPFFPNKNYQIKKKLKQKKMLLGGGGGGGGGAEEGLIQLFNAKISPNYVSFTFTKEMKVKYILTSL